MADYDDDSERGYGKPPKSKRFKKGQSGNPSGRPKGTKNIADLLSKVCLEPVRVRGENGRSYTMSKIEAAMTQVINKAAKGDDKATKTSFTIMKMFPTLMEAPPPAPPKIVIHFVKAKDGKPVPDDPDEEAVELSMEEWLKRDRSEESE